MDSRCWDDEGFVSEDEGDGGESDGRGFAMKPFWVFNGGFMF